MPSALRLQPPHCACCVLTSHTHAHTCTCSHTALTRAATSSLFSTVEVAFLGRTQEMAGQLLCGLISPPFSVVCAQGVLGALCPARRAKTTGAIGQGGIPRLPSAQPGRQHAGPAVVSWPHAAVSGGRGAWVAASSVLDAWCPLSPSVLQRPQPLPLWVTGGVSLTSSHTVSRLQVVS